MPGGRVALYASVGPELTHYEVDVEDMTLTRRGTVELPAHIHYCWPHANRRFLYVAGSDAAPGAGGMSVAVGNTHYLTALAIDPASGALSRHGAPIELPTRPIHMTTDIPSEYILVAFSNQSGLSVYRVNSDFTPGREVDQFDDIDPGIYAHQVRVRPDNRMVILVARGHDANGVKSEEPGALKVFGYQNGQLTAEISVAPGGGYGFGPRHLDFHPTEPWVYVSLERQNRLDMFHHHETTLLAAPLDQKGTLAEPDNIRGRQVAGTVHVHPDGRFVYVANRASTVRDGVFVGGENNLAVFAIDAKSGAVEPIQHADTLGIHCRTFHIDPSGRLLVAAHITGLKTDDRGFVPACLSLFRIGDDGRLDFVRKYDVEVGERTMWWMGMVAL